MKTTLQVGSINNTAAFLNGGTEVQKVRLCTPATEVTGDDVSLPKGTTVIIPITDKAQMATFAINQLVTVTFTPVPPAA